MIKIIFKEYFNIKYCFMQQDIIIKFCVVGQPNVGKSSMLFQYVHKKFDQKLRPTIGCDFSTKLKSNIDGQPIRLQLWDIAGQQRYNAVSKMYLRGALGCAVVCSAVDENTLNQTLKWKKIIQQNGDFGAQVKIPLILIMNKSDLIDSSEIQQFQSKAYLQNFANENGFAGFIFTSAKQNKNIDDAFQQLLDQTVKRGLVKGKKPPTAAQQRKQLQNETKKSEVIKLKNQSIVRKQQKNKGCCK